MFSFLVTSYLRNGIHKHTSSPPIDPSTPWNTPKDPTSPSPLPVPYHTNTTCSALSPTQFGPSPSPSRALFALSNSVVYISIRFP